MKISVILSCYNRSELFARGLESYTWQTMPKEDFEILIIDDGSTEDLSKVYKPYIGKLNIKHIKFDHKKHPIWQQMNTPEFKAEYHVPDNEELFYHTPALSMNIGIHHAQGEVICTCQPEIILSPDALKMGYNHVKFGGYQTYGEVVLATQTFNDWLKLNFENRTFEELIKTVDHYGREHTFLHEQGEMYWMLAFYLKEKCVEINGVDLEYLKGVYGEDDNFRTRIRLTGTNDYYGGRTSQKLDSQGTIIGIHQSHYHEKNLYKKQDRDSSFWNIGANKNRARWSEFCRNPQKMANENLNFNEVWGVDCITSIKEYYV